MQVANVTVRMEQDGAMCEENMQFANLVNDQKGTYYER